MLPVRDSTFYFSATWGNLRPCARTRGRVARIIWELAKGQTKSKGSLQNARVCMLNKPQRPALSNVKGSKLTKTLMMNWKVCLSFRFFVGSMGKSPWLLSSTCGLYGRPTPLSRFGWRWFGAKIVRVFFVLANTSTILHTTWTTHNWKCYVSVVSTKDRTC